MLPSLDHSCRSPVLAPHVLPLALPPRRCRAGRDRSLSRLQGAWPPHDDAMLVAYIYIYIYIYQCNLREGTSFDSLYSHVPRLLCKLLNPSQKTWLLYADSSLLDTIYLMKNLSATPFPPVPGPGGLREALTIIIVVIVVVVILSRKS